MPVAISAGKEVSIEYTLRLEDQEVVETNVGSESLTYVHGTGQIIPGLETALDGMQAGESKEVTVQPENAYGPVIPEAFREVSKDRIPEDAQKVGVRLQGRDPNGEVVHARVAQVKPETLVLDFNHPLAGKTLLFEVKVVRVEEPSAP
jgi:FKBP-type peptidyl-prolyl cis-trans isomerase SlyD